MALSLINIHVNVSGSSTRFFNVLVAPLVVADATCLERNLNLVLQVMELTDNIVLCVNLMDEAKRKGITVDIEELEKKLGIPVVATTARKGEGLDQLLNRIYNIALEKETTFPNILKYPLEVEEEITRLSQKLEKLLDDKLSTRWVALRLLEGDTTILDSINTFLFDNNINSMDKEGDCIYEY